MEIKIFWDKAVSYQDYIKETENRLSNPSDYDKEYEQYYQLGLQRMNRMYEKYTPNPEQQESLESKKFKGKILIISEPWCGDASQVIPVVEKFFEHNDVRISYRDQEPSLIDDFLTGGAKSIPVVIFLSDEFEVIGTWGPRPKHGIELLQRYKSDPENFSKEQFYVALQTYYAKNRGLDTIEELLEII